MEDGQLFSKFGKTKILYNLSFTSFREVKPVRVGEVAQFRIMSCHHHSLPLDTLECSSLLFEFIANKTETVTEDSQINIKQT